MVYMAVCGILFNDEGESMDKKFVYKILKQWIPLAALATLLCGVIYLAIQQTFRMDANDPQVQYTEDIKSALEGGTTPEQIAGSSTVDISKSLDAFIVIFGSDKKIAASTAVLNGGSPSIPNGVLDVAAKSGETRVTWQPQKGVRIATVVLKYKNGYILVGRNMREVESRIGRQGINILIGWALTLVATLFTVAAVRVVYNKVGKKN
jgi:hypothetical protein